MRSASFMKTLGSLLLYIIPVIYLIAVIVCIGLGFDYSGRIDSDWVLVLMGLTLPWSIVSVLFIWALIHGAGLEFFTVMYLLFAVINAVILNRIGAAISKRYRVSIDQ